MKKNKSEKFPFTLDTKLEMMPDDEFEELLANMKGCSVHVNPKPLFQLLAENPKGPEGKGIKDKPKKGRKD